MASSERPLEPSSWRFAGEFVCVTQEVQGTHFSDSMVITFVNIRPQSGSPRSTPKVFKTNFPSLYKIRKHKGAKYSPEGAGPESLLGECQVARGGVRHGALPRTTRKVRQVTLLRHLSRWQHFSGHKKTQ